MDEQEDALNRVHALVDLAERAIKDQPPPLAPTPTPEDLARLPADTTPRAGKLGWIALRTGMVEAVELQICLQLQIQRPELPIGAMLVQRGLVDEQQLEQMLELQTAWTELCRIHALDDRLAEHLAQFLVGHQRFDTGSVQSASDGELDPGMRLLFGAAGVEPDTDPPAEPPADPDA